MATKNQIVRIKCGNEIKIIHMGVRTLKDKWSKKMSAPLGEEIYRQQQENGWGKYIVQVLSNELPKEFPGAKGYSAANLWRMRYFYLTYREFEKLAPLVRETSWSNNVVIMEKCKDDLQREYYIQMTKRYGWTKRVLTNFVEDQTYEKYLLNQTNFDLTLPPDRRSQTKLAVKGEYTILIVAHRLSTVIDCDKIFVVNDGKIIDCGTHKELLIKCNSYKNLYEKDLKI